MTPNIITIIFAAIGIIFLILSARKANSVQSKAWLRTGIIFLVVAAVFVLVNLKI